MEELLLADPAGVMDDAPEDSEEVQVEVDVVEMRSLALGLRPAGLRDEQEGVEGEVVDALAHGEAMGLWNGGGALEGPCQQVR